MPFAVGPAWIWTVTGVVSVAVPLKDGVALSDGDSGMFSVTVGAAVSTVKVTGRLSLVACVARAV